LLHSSWDWAPVATRFGDDALAFIVVDVTRQNPNVFYELGFAHALRKPTILLASAAEKRALPSDLDGFQFIVYDGDNLRSLVDNVQRAAKGFVVGGEEPE
jgi:predicted nucleotide-binding protein